MSAPLPPAGAPSESAKATAAEPGAGAAADPVTAAEPSPPQPPEPPDPLLGTVLGDRYRILERLGRGGMGAVYKAQHIHLQTLVAVKVLLRRDGTVSERRFFHEARLASQVKHPNTVYVTDFGTLPDGRPYLVMEYLAGRTLDAVHKEGPLAPRRAVHIALEIVRGVRAIHKQGILHRDLKPQQVSINRAPPSIVPHRLRRACASMGADAERGGGPPDAIYR